MKHHLHKPVWAFRLAGWLVLETKTSPSPPIYRCQHEERTAQFCCAVVALAQKHCVAGGNDKQKLYRSCGMMVRGAEVGDVYTDAHDITGGLNLPCHDQLPGPDQDTQHLVY